MCLSYEAGQALKNELLPKGRGWPKKLQLPFRPKGWKQDKPKRVQFREIRPLSKLPSHQTYHSRNPQDHWQFVFRPVLPPTVPLLRGRPWRAPVEEHAARFSVHQQKMSCAVLTEHRQTAGEPTGSVAGVRCC